MLVSLVLRTVSRTNSSAYIYKNICQFNGYKKLSKFSFNSIRSFCDFGANEPYSNKYRVIDNISNDYKVIYRNTTDSLMLYTQWTAILCGSTLPVISLYIYFIQGYQQYPVSIGSVTLAKSPFDYLVFYAGLIFFITQVLVVTSQLPLRIYRSKNNFIIVSRSWLPWRNNKICLTSGQLKKVENSYLPWSEAIYQVNDKRVLILEDYFEKPIDFDDMLEEEAKKRRQEEEE